MNGQTDDNSSINTNQQTKSNEKSFEFSIALLASFSYMFSVIYNYTNTHTINLDLYETIVLCASAISVFIVVLLMYILFKMLVMEAPNNIKEQIEHFSSILYNIASLFALISLLLCISIILIYFKYITYSITIFSIGFIVITLIWFSYFFNAKKASVIYLSIIIALYLITKLTELYPTASLVISFLILIALVPILYVFKENEMIQNPKQHMKLMTLSIFIPFLIILLIALMILFASMFNTLPFLHGELDIEMDNVYIAGENPIPFMVHVTGPISTMDINLNKIESDYNVSQIDYMMIGATNHSLNVSYSEKKYLVGNAANAGCYEIFINSSNISSGYYKIECKRPQFSNEYTEKTFILK